MKDIYTIYEASLLDINNQLNISDKDVDNRLLYNKLMSNDSEQFKEVRDILFAEAINGKKLVRKSAFKHGKVYIQFFDDNDFKDPNAYGFRFGTCNPVVKDKDVDITYIDIIVSMPNINNAHYGLGISIVYGNKQDPMKINSYLKRSTYELPERYINLYKSVAKALLAKKYPKNPTFPKIIDSL